MTPKEKAEELFDKMSTNNGDEHHHCTHYVAKQCALIAVDMVINEGIENAVDDFYSDQGYYICNFTHKILGYNEYWDEVKKEIENL